MFHLTLTRLLVATVVLSSLQSSDAQDSSNSIGEKVRVPLHVDAGTPLRLYLTKRARYTQGEAAEAKLAEPVWAFDRIVIPAGTPVRGAVVDLQPVSKMARSTAIVRGDFTPLKHASVSFTSLAVPGAAPISLDTQPSLGLASIFVPPRPGKDNQAKSEAPSNSRSERVKRFVKQQAQAQANTRSRGLLDFVRGPNKREWLENFLWSKLPYHPQWYRSGTRFDAVLNQPLDFGEQEVAASSLLRIGTTPPPDSPALIRLVSTVSSADAKVGDPLEAVLAKPLFNSQKQLVLPEGTRMSGKVTLTRRARMFHRGGQLRFAFTSIEPTKLASISAPSPDSEPAFAQLTAAESSTGSVKVDEEGTAKATESKTRFIRPVIAGLIAAKSLDNDEGRSTASGGGAGGNASGRGLGGFSGFGLLGTAASYGPKPIGAALGFYGLAWSAYSTIVARGTEVTFEKNSAMAIRFGAVRK